VFADQAQLYGILADGGQRVARRSGREDLTNRQFVGRVATRIDRGLQEQAPLGEARLRRRGSMLQVDFGRRPLHYEAWVQRSRGQVEVGLHLEGDAAGNGRLMQCLAPQMLAIRAELGDDVELEQWTKSWGRVHTLVDFDLVDAALVERVSERLLAFILCLQPRIEDCLAGQRMGSRSRR
jgi:hypothetical protein